MNKTLLKTTHNKNYNKNYNFEKDLSLHLKSSSRRVENISGNRKSCREFGLTLSTSPALFIVSLRS